MAKIAVVYQSKYGAAEKYAGWIAEEVGADLFNAEKIKAKDVEDYDIIIFGGGIQAGGIEGIEFIQKNYRKCFADKKVYTFAVGLRVDDKENQQQCRMRNFKHAYKELPCLFLKGAYDPEKVRGMDKKIMNMVIKMSNDESLINDIKNGADYTDKQYIAPLTDVVKQAASEIDANVVV